MKRWQYEPIAAGRYTADEIWKRLRTADITSTESAALFGMSPYTTRYQLWHAKRSRQVVEIPQNERMTWGIRLQEAVARGIAADHGVEVDAKPDYCRLVDARMGASFDFEIVDVNKYAVDLLGETPLVKMFRRLGKGICEVKCVDYIVFRDQWEREDKTIEAPDHIEVQLQHQLHVSGYKWGAIFVLVAGHTPYVLIREYDAKGGAALEKAVRSFWQSVRDGIEPPPEMPIDADAYCRLHGYAEPNKFFDGRGNTELLQACADYKAAAAAEKDATEKKKAARATIYQCIGDAESASTEGFKIWAGVVGPAEIPAYTREGFRSIRITKQKTA